MPHTKGKKQSWVCLITDVNAEPGRGESRGSLETMGHQPHPKQQQAPG